jgi:lipopolysaccharide heptosyltransferase I
VKLSSLGDLFHALPAVHEIRRLTGARIDWVAHDAYVPLVRCFRDVERVIPFPRQAFVRGARSFLRELRRDRYDWIVDLQGLLKSAVVTRLARGARRVGPAFAREGSGLFYGEVVPAGARDRHAVDINLDAARYLGCRCGPPRFPLAFPAWTGELERPAVVLVPVSRWPSKNWRPHGFGELGARLAAAGVRTVVILGGKQDAAVCEAVAARTGPAALNLCGRTSLPETGGVIARTDLLIANDSGPVHLAAALGKPTLVLFGPTEARRTGPYGEGHRTLDAGLDCRPCFRRVCPGGHTRCMEALAPESVCAAALDMLDCSLQAARARLVPG